MDMKVCVVHPQSPIEWNWNSALLIPVYENNLPVDCPLLTEEQEVAIQAMIDRDLFHGKENEILFIPFPNAPFAGTILAGLGPQNKTNEEKIRRLSPKVVECSRAQKITNLFAYWEKTPAEYIIPFIEGTMLSQFSYEQYKNPETTQKDKPTPLTQMVFIVPKDVDTSTLNNQCAQTITICESVSIVRSLICSPANELTPQSFAKIAQDLCPKDRVTIHILDKKSLEEKGLNCIVAVGKGSQREPLLLVLEYNLTSTSQKPIALVGKGVTFDTGGICLKPRDDMQDMRYDMSGAGVVLGTIYALAELKVGVPIVGIIPLVENMPGGSALLPGDIIKTYSGKTVEVLNTDAEGRLILADAISYVQKNYNPDKVIDIATLTGGCIIALGHYSAGLMSNNDNLAEELRKAGDETGERIWTLPLWDDYEKLIQSDFADIANIGPKSEASTIVGGMFLKQFVEKDTPWAHIDIAGTAWGVKHINYWDSKYPTGYGVRLLTHWILKYNK